MQKPLRGRSRRRHAATAVALGIALCATGLSQPVRASAQAVSTFSVALGGQVTDALGNVLEGVEVLIVDGSGSLLPLARATTDPTGRFRLPALEPGHYRYAALKDGYRTRIGEFDSTARRVLDLVLSPMPRTEEALSRLPGDDAWVLRVPRRNVFRETRPVADGGRAAGTGDASSGAERALFADHLTMQLRHLMAVDGSGSGSGSESPGGDPAAGSETMVRVASNLGERGQLSLTGLRDSRGETRVDGSPPADRDERAFAFDFSYATGADSELEMSAFYRSQDVQWATPPTAGFEDGDGIQAERAWGYASRWSMQLDPVSRVDVSVDVRNHSLDMGAAGGGAPAVGDLLLDMKSGLSQRAVRAAGSYSSAAVDGHQLQVGLRAQLLDVPAVRFDGATSAPVGLADGALGWSVLVDAEDRWTVAAPFTLVYGLGYKHVVDPVDTSLLVPRLGGTLNLAPIVLGFDVSYHAVSAWEEDPALSVWSSPLSADRAIGYSAELQVPLGGEVSMRASHRQDPVQLDPGITSWQPSLWMDRPLFRTDGNAAVRENRVVLAREAGGTRTYVELATGDAVGMVNPVRPFHDGFELLTRSSLRFANGRVGVRVAPSGTDVRLDFSRVEERDAATPAGSDLDRVRDAVELRILQDILRFESLGQWRLLMAFRLESVEDGGALDGGDDGPDRLSAENRGVSAGLSVTF